MYFNELLSKLAKDISYPNTYMYEAVIKGKQTIVFLIFTSLKKKFEVACALIIYTTYQKQLCK